MIQKAKRYRAGAERQTGATDPSLLLSAIELFLASCSRPAVMDFGDEPIELQAGRYALELASGRLVFEAWDETRSLSRRILSITEHKTGVLDCSVHRFGGAAGRLTFLDLNRPQTAVRALKGSRQNFAEQFRRMLQRQYPGWEIQTLTSAMDLRRSFSPLYPRAHLTLGNRYLAALACPSAEDEPAFITAALLWHDALRGRLRVPGPVNLCLFLPETAGNLTAQRLRWLTGIDLGTRLFRFNQHGMAGEVDPCDLGNLDTRVAAHYVPVGECDAWKAVLARLAALPGVGCCPEVGGALSIRFRGLEFARLEKGKMLLGIESCAEIDQSQAALLEEYAAQLSELAPSSQSGPAYRGLPSFPERWFESAVRSHLQQIDPDLHSTPLHGQVLSFAAGDRECLDLLAVSSAGRLSVIELKTAEDLQLPMQGLDYWMRVGWHADRNELDHLFPSIKLRKEQPKLLLIAPALMFHPTNEIVLRYFAPSIEVQRIGVHSEWQSTLRIAYRLQGAELPISHRGADDSRRAHQHKKGNRHTESA